MKLQVLAGALALSLGATVLAPVAAQADDRYQTALGSELRTVVPRRSFAVRTPVRTVPLVSGARGTHGTPAYSRSYRHHGSYYRSYRSYPSYYRGDSYYGGYYAPYATGRRSSSRRRTGMATDMATDTAGTAIAGIARCSACGWAVPIRSLARVLSEQGVQ